VSRAVRRHHRARIIAKHVRQYRELMDRPVPPVAASVYVGCRRARCLLCHPHNVDHRDRRVAERAWRQLEDAAW
jgi:hypothetical protein